jgi:hypothetical protein
MGTVLKFWEHWAVSQDLFTTFFRFRLAKMGQITEAITHNCADNIPYEKSYNKIKMIVRHKLVLKLNFSLMPDNLAPLVLPLQSRSLSLHGNPDR